MEKQLPTRLSLSNALLAATTPHIARTLRPRSSIFSRRALPSEEPHRRHACTSIYRRGPRYPIHRRRRVRARSTISCTCNRTTWFSARTPHEHHSRVHRLRNVDPGGRGDHYVQVRQRAHPFRPSIVDMEPTTPHMQIPFLLVVQLRVPDVLRMRLSCPYLTPSRPTRRYRTLSRVTSRLACHERTRRSRLQHIMVAHSVCERRRHSAAPPIVEPFSICRHDSRRRLIRASRRHHGPPSYARQTIPSRMGCSTLPPPTYLVVPRRPATVL